MSRGGFRGNSAGRGGRGGGGSFVFVNIQLIAN